MSGTWERLADLPLEIEDYSLEPLSALVSSDFERASTVIHLRGAGAEGVGEDVTKLVLAAHRERFSWDAPIHSVADLEALRYAPRMVNIKPSRLGGLRSLLDAFDRRDYRIARSPPLHRRWAFGWEPTRS